MKRPAGHPVGRFAVFLKRFAGNGMPIARSISLGTDRPSDRSKTCRIQPKPNLADQLWALGFDPSAIRKTFFSTFFSANQANRRGAAGFWSISKPFFFSIFTVFGHFLIKSQKKWKRERQVRDHFPFDLSENKSIKRSTKTLQFFNT